MTRTGRFRLSLLLGAACAAAAAAAALPFLGGAEPSARPAPLAQEARLNVANLALPPLETFPETTRRPLFSTTRSPAVAAVQPAAGRDGLILGRYAFVGVMVTRDRRLLLIRPAAGGGVLRLKEGDALDAWRIEKIAADALTLSGGGKTETIPLRRPK